MDGETKIECQGSQMSDVVSFWLWRTLSLTSSLSSSVSTKSDKVKGLSLEPVQKIWKLCNVFINWLKILRMSTIFHFSASELP